MAIPAGWLFSPVQVRWSTLLMAAVILAVVGVRRRRPAVAVVSVVAWLAVYETGWQLMDLVVHHAAAWPAAVQRLGWASAALAGWPLLAHALGVRPDPRWAALCALVFAVWLWSGFWYNWPGQPYPLMIGPELANVASKTALGIAYLAGAVRRTLPPLGEGRVGA
jgi:hypothetical protein